MLPDNCKYHSLEQIALIQQLTREQRISVRDAMFLATQLVHHGFAHAGDFVARLRSDLQSTPANGYLTQLMRRHAVIQSLPCLKEVQSDGEAVGQLLDNTGYTFRPGSFRHDTAIVIFTTVFNNFGVSNVVTDAFLAQLGVSRLYLKDGTDFSYFRGVEGLADSLGDLPDAVADLLASRGIRETIVTGFSSGGYASLHFATSRRYAGYVGYAIYTDISATSPLIMPEFLRRVRDRVPPEYYIDLRPRLADNPQAMPCKLFFGKSDVEDRVHAMHLIDCPTVEVTCHADGGHDVTLPLIDDGRFLEPFEELLARR